MRLRPLEIFYSFSAGIDSRRQNLTSVRQILTSKVDRLAVMVYDITTLALINMSKIQSEVSLYTTLQTRGAHPGCFYAWSASKTVDQR